MGLVLWKSECEYGITVGRVLGSGIEFEKEA